MLGGSHPAIQERAAKVQQRLQHVLAEADLASSANSLLTSMTTAMVSETPHWDAIVVQRSRVRGGSWVVHVQLTAWAVRLEVEVVILSRSSYTTESAERARWE